MSDRTLADHARAVAGFDTSPGTLRFQPERPPSAALIGKLVRSRVAEIAELAEKTAARKSARSSTRRRARR